MVKILHIIDYLSGGGKERRMIQLVKGLSLSGQYEQHILVLKNKVTYNEIYDSDAVIHIAENTSNRYNEIKSRIEIIRKIKPDIVHSWIEGTTDMFLLPILKLKYGFKYIAGFIANSNVVKKKSLHYLSCLFTYHYADAIVSNSQAGLYAKNAITNHSYVIYNGFDFNRFTEISKRIKRNEMNVVTSYIAVMIARFEDAKDYESFVKLAKLSYEKQLDVTFLAIGQGPNLQNYIDKYSADVPNLLFLGQRSDIEQILQIADFSFLFTDSSKHAEGVSNSIMESMAAGLPTIATIGGGTQEIIDDSQCGFVIAPGDYHKAFELLVKLMEDKKLYTSISKASKQKIIDKFLLSNMIDEYEFLYNTVLSK